MKLMVLDGNSIVNRAFYGIRPLTTRQGLYTNAIYGFVTTLQRLLDEEKPEALCVTFDRREPTFRHQADASYKAQRKGMPEELAMQMLPLKQVLTAMSIPQYELTGYEAVVERDLLVMRIAFYVDRCICIVYKLKVFAGALSDRCICGRIHIAYDHGMIITFRYFQLRK